MILKNRAVSKNGVDIIKVEKRTLNRKNVQIASIHIHTHTYHERFYNFT